MQLLGIVDQFGLTQHQLKVTRPAAGNILYLVLCSNPNLVKSVEVLPGMCDHLAVLTTLDVQPKQYINKPHNVLSIVRLTLKVSAETCLIPRSSSCLQAWTAAHDMSSETGSVLRMLTHQPSTRTSRLRAQSQNVAHRGPREPYNLNSEERIVVTIRHVVHGLPIKLRQHTQQQMRSAHNSDISDVIGARLLEGGNQKRFWSYVKLNKTENMSVPILSDREGLHITDQAKSEAINIQFVSVFTQDDGKDLPDKGLSPYGEIPTRLSQTVVMRDSID